MKIARRLSEPHHRYDLHLESDSSRFSSLPHIVAMWTGELAMLQEFENTAEMRTRCPPSLRDRVKAAAEKSVRSISAEIAYRLEKSFEYDKCPRP